MQGYLLNFFIVAVSLVDCNHQVTSMLRQNKFLEKLLKTLDVEPGKVRYMFLQLVKSFFTDPFETSQTCQVVF